MSVEGPFVAALIARLADPTFNLAGYGVAFAFALIFESPIMMVLSAATALVRDRQSYSMLLRFVMSLNVMITGAMLLLLVPPVFRFIVGRLIDLPPDVAHLTYEATWLLLPWPASIGYRRFFHGILIRSNQTRRVAAGTLVRIPTMALTGVALYAWSPLPGACVGAGALACGVVVEAAAARLMAAGTVRRILTHDDRLTTMPPLTTKAVTQFYLPLALTSVITLAVNPLVTFFIGHAKLAVESLAVLPVVTSLVFVFRSVAVAYQEVGIALLDDQRDSYPALRRFAALLAAFLVGTLALLVFTPLGGLWLRWIAGLSPNLVDLSGVPLRLLFVMPGLEVLLSLQRSLLVHDRRTGLISLATGIEVTGIVITLVAGVSILGGVGVVVAASGLVVGRLAANLFLLRPAFATAQSAGQRHLR